MCFAPLTSTDDDVLNGEDWQGARFDDVWRTLSAHETALKLTICKGRYRPLPGIVQIGMTQRLSGGESVLRDSLLETAPVYRSGMKGRRYRGIGRVLVARLIIQSKVQGAEGRLLVRPAPASKEFYRHLGFREARQPSYFRLAVQDAEALLQPYLISNRE